MRRTTFLVLLSLLSPLACGTSRDDQAQITTERTDRARADEPLPKTVDVSRQDLIFRYWDESSGGYETQTSWSALPDSALRLVIVRDPQRRHPGKFLIADRKNCTSATPCPVVVMSGRQLERAIAKQRGVAPPSDDRRITKSQRPTLNFFTASWCSACNKARAYLKKNGIAHREFDVEKDSTARTRLMQVGKGKGMGPEQLSSVPIFTYGTEIMVGFAPARLKQLMRRLGS